MLNPFVHQADESDLLLGKDMGVVVRSLLHKKTLVGIRFNDHVILRIIILIFRIARSNMLLIGDGLSGLVGLCLLRLRLLLVDHTLFFVVGFVQVLATSGGEKLIK
ncbi:hypothetical protein PG993_008817 [Apiospora rasikravindrae]|uniref:Uncharacterized protein n=1 Tax=Apiospora rasikravindrae TaxID=990691 RepID=A0ABR1SPF9_9PEZI